MKIELGGNEVGGCSEMLIVVLKLKGGPFQFPLPPLPCFTIPANVRNLHLK